MSEKVKVPNQQPQYKIRRPKVNVPKRYVVMSPNKFWLRAMVVALHENAQRSNRNSSMYAGDKD
jgi:hypothetical protein